MSLFLIQCLAYAGISRHSVELMPTGCIASQLHTTHLRERSALYKNKHITVERAPAIEVSRSVVFCDQESAYDAAAGHCFLFELLALAAGLQPLS